MNKKKQIFIKGIQTDAPDGMHEPGSMQEVINAKHDNGAWRPHMGYPLVEDSHASFSESGAILYKHSALPSNYIISAGQGMYIKVMDIEAVDDGSSTSIIWSMLLESGETVNDVKSVGNILVISTSTRLLRLFWNEEDSAYVDLSDLPDSPIMSFGNLTYSHTDDEVNDDLPDDVVKTADPYYFNYNFSVEDDDTAVDTFRSFCVHLRNKGYFIGSLCIRFAYQLFDGSYVMHSEPMLIAGRKYVDLDHRFLWRVNTTGSYWKAEMSCVKGELLITQDQIDAIEPYKDIISNIIVAVTTVKSDIYPVDDYAGGDVELTIESTFNNMDELFCDPNYHIIHRIPITEYIKDINYKVELNQDKLKDVQTNEALNIDESQSHLKFNAALLSRYNSRIALIQPSYIFPDFIVNASNIIYTIDANKTTYFVVELVDEGRTFYTRKEVSGKSIQYIYRNIAYPDIRAVKLTIYEHDSSSSPLNVVIKHEISLTPVTLMNISYALADTMNKDMPYGYDATTLFPAIFTPGTDTMLLADIPAERNELITKESVRYSELFNPWTFKSSHAYSFENEVDNIGVSTHPVSQGQFGQFPVYVFTKGGIWAMEQGSSDVLFSNKIPVSRETTNTPLSVTGTEIGIIFTNKDGLYVISGSEVNLLSDKIDGYPEQGIHANQDYKLFVKDPSLVGSTTTIKNKFPDLYDLLSTELFSSYAQGAITAYIGGKFYDLIVSNNTYDFHYIFSLKTGMITKRTGSFNQLFSVYPAVWGVKAGENGLFDTSKENDTDNYAEVLLETNPVSSYFADFAIHRLIMRCKLIPDTSIITGLYLFTSNDCYTWNLGGSKQTLESLFDMALSMSAGKFKFFKIVITGKLKGTSEIKMIEFLEDIKMKNNIS